MSDLSKLKKKKKKNADDKINNVKKVISVYDTVENTKSKAENTVYNHFLLSLDVIQKFSLFR